MQKDAETVQAAPALAAHLQNSPVRPACTVAFVSPIAFGLLPVRLLFACLLLICFVFPLIY